MKKDSYREYKKLTIEIPILTFKKMDIYCRSDINPFKKNIYYCNFIKKAIEFYIHSHKEYISAEKIQEISAVR